MKITLFGNCQTKALSWYIEQLDQSFDVQWICIERFIGERWVLREKWNGKSFKDQPKVIANTQEAIKRLQSSDYVIYQNIKKESSDNYNARQLQKHVTDGKLLSISSMFYDPDDPREVMLKGMIERAEEYNIDIPAHKIIEKHGSKITMKSGKNHHPQIFYFLELVREICIKTGWNYYSNKQYKQFLKEAWPFG